MSNKILTFQECIQLANKSEGKKHLILGNGFSMALFPDIFSYKSLSERINNKETRAKNIFKKFKTNDFEYVLRELTKSINVLECYKQTATVQREIKKDIEKLKQILIDVISISHPENPGKITDVQYNSCREFLKHFDNDGKKYTFNYDLILYWVYMHFRNNKDLCLKCDDGFRSDENNHDTIVWEIGMEQVQNLYYIHGALHVFFNGFDIEKYTWLNSGKTIKQQVKESLAESKYPIFITEGSKEQKRARIHENAYLARGFASLKNIHGNLFVFGHSLRNEDDHVFNLVNSRSRVKNIFISIYGDKNTPQNKFVIDKISKWKGMYQGKNYYMFDASTAKVWDNISN